MNRALRNRIRTGAGLLMLAGAVVASVATSQPPARVGAGEVVSAELVPGSPTYLTLHLRESQAREYNSGTLDIRLFPETETTRPIAWRVHTYTGAGDFVEAVEGKYPGSWDYQRGPQGLQVFQECEAELPCESQAVLRLEVLDDAGPLSLEIEVFLEAFFGYDDVPEGFELEIIADEPVAEAAAIRDSAPVVETLVADDMAVRRVSVEVDNPGDVFGGKITITANYADPQPDPAPYVLLYVDNPFTHETQDALLDGSGPMSVTVQALQNCGLVPECSAAVDVTLLLEADALDTDIEWTASVQANYAGAVPEDANILVTVEP